MDSTGRRPKRSLGQNFLVDPNLQRKIVAEGHFEPGDEVLEIGPGEGALTDHLANLDVRLILVELDDALARRWSARFEGDPRVRVVHDDILQIAPERLSDRPRELRVIGNIPYNITAPILFTLLSRPRPRDILVMVQREVADRILADPGTRAYGALAVGVRSVARVERVLEVSRNAFRPRPRVDSTVVRITPIHPEPLTLEEEEELRILVRSTFQWRRKQLQKILRDHPDLQVAREAQDTLFRELGLSGTARPESLSPDQFIEMSRVLSSLRGSGADPSR